MFLDEHERLILLHQRNNPLTQESLKNFAGVGVKTMRLCYYSPWHEIEPSPGRYSWDVIDRAIGEARGAGLKVLVELYDRAPFWLPGVLCPEAGTIFGADIVHGMPFLAMVHPFNTEAMKIEAEFLERACERLTGPGVECRYGMPSGGERILPPGLSYTERQVVDLVVGRQRIFAKHSEGLGTAFHLYPAVTSISGGTPEYVGNEHLWACYDAMKVEFPDHTLNRLIYEYFTAGGIWDCRIEGVKTWVGAEYARNVVYAATHFHPRNVWGLLMGHSPFREEPRQPTSQEYDNTAKAIEILEKSYEPWV